MYVYPFCIITERFGGEVMIHPAEVKLARALCASAADRGLDDKDTSKFKCGEIRKASGGCLSNARREHNVAFFGWRRCAACCDLAFLGSSMNNSSVGFCNFTSQMYTRKCFAPRSVCSKHIVSA